MMEEFFYEQTRLDPRDVRRNRNGVEFEAPRDEAVAIRLQQIVDRLEEVVAQQREIRDTIGELSRSEGWRATREEANSRRLAEIQAQLDRVENKQEGMAGTLERIALPEKSIQDEEESELVVDPREVEVEGEDSDSAYS